MASRLEQELKQNRPFARKASEAGVAIVRTAAMIDHAWGEALRAFGVTGTQYNVLRILRGAGDAGLCGREVGERLVSQVPDVSRLLERMEELGLITRERDPGDRRHVTARISAKGHRVLVDAEPELESLERRYFGALEPDQLQQLIDALAVVRNRR